MTSPGQPNANPFLQASRQAGDRLAGAGMGQPNAASMSNLISRSRAGQHRGISKLGTESRLKELSMQKATAISVVLHVTSPVVLAVLALLLMLLLSWLMHFNFWDFFKPQQKRADMEFTLVRDTQATKPEHPLFKGNFNQRAGGKRNPDQTVKATEDPAQSAPAKKQEVTQPKPEPVAQQALQPAPQPPKPQPKQPAQPKAADKPAFKPLISLPSKAAQAPEPSETASGPVASVSHSSSASATGPASSQIASLGSSFSGIGTQGSLGNPQGGPGLSGVDVEQDVDYGPYMAELQRRIKLNWESPRSTRDRKIVVLFYVARDGNLVNDRGQAFQPGVNPLSLVEFVKSSGDQDADLAAVEAIRRSVPFRPLPPTEKAAMVPIQFTFDYNVLSPKGANKRG